MTKERPILFSAPMVRALLADTKTQTRRVVKAARDPNIGCWMTPGEIALDSQTVQEYISPYGQPGDRLWVRETWLRHSINKPNDFLYRADHPDDDIIGPAHGGWKPSIHMPRLASRLTLEITGMRVERLQEISEADAKAEGITSRRVSTGDCRTGLTDAWSVDGAFDSLDPRESFELLWSSINGAESWAASPWVWVVEFKRAA